jgi:DNA repair photolyase
MPASYKHAISVSSQVYFCAAPIRLDSYNGCQFGCVYCFSRARSRMFASSGIHLASVAALRARLGRVQTGEYRSALDELLGARVPLQLGGLHDPFTPREATLGVSKKIMELLRDYQHPTLISTKGSILTDANYVAILREMNVVVRFSAAGVEERARATIDRGCDSFDDTLRKLEKLNVAGIPTGLRIQPVIPGFERDAIRMTESAARVGVKQVSFEYLKVATESLNATDRLLRRATGTDIIAHMERAGALRMGWDYSLATTAKRAFVLEARSTCHKLGLRFGAGDTEFIPWSDGDGCCGSDSKFLPGAKQFSSNLVGAIKRAVQRNHNRLTFSDLSQSWSPKFPISTYLNPNSRNALHDGQRTDWMGLLARRWNGDHGPYSPTLFDGVSWSGKTDRDGFKVYDTSVMARALKSSSPVESSLTPVGECADKHPLRSTQRTSPRH